MTAPASEGHPVIHLAVAGALDADVLESMVRFAHATIRAGCAELVLQLHALTDFPSRLFTELHRLDQAARLHHCRLQLLGLDEAIATALCTSRAKVVNLSTPASPAVGHW